MRRIPSAYPPQSFFHAISGFFRVFERRFAEDAFLYLPQRKQRNFGLFSGFAEVPPPKIYKSSRITQEGGLQGAFFYFFCNSFGKIWGILRKSAKSDAISGFFLRKIVFCTSAGNKKVTQFRAFFCGGYLPHILRTSSATSAKMEKKVIVVECSILYPPHIFRKKKRGKIPLLEKNMMCCYYLQPHFFVGRKYSVVLLRLSTIRFSMPSLVNTLPTVQALHCLSSAALMNWLAVCHSSPSL